MLVKDLLPTTNDHEAALTCRAVHAAPMGAGAICPDGGRGNRICGTVAARGEKRRRYEVVDRLGRHRETVAPGNASGIVTAYLPIMQALTHEGLLYTAIASSSRNCIKLHGGRLFGDRRCKFKSRKTPERPPRSFSPGSSILRALRSWPCRLRLCRAPRAR